MLIIEAIQKYCNIYCICLKERNDRYENVSKEFNKIGIRELVYFHRPTHHEKGGIYGNFESMLWCINHSLNLDSSKLILIFEDDVCFSVNRFLQVELPNSFIDNIETWDTIRLGYWKGIFIEKLYNTDFYRGNCRGAHATIWSPIFARRVLNHNITIEHRGIIDWYLAETSGRHYLLHKAICFQTPGLATDVIWPFKNIQCDFLKNPIQFQLKYQQRTNNAWDYIGRYISNHFLAGIFQIGMVMDCYEIWDMIRTMKCYYIFNNKSLL